MGSFGFDLGVALDVFFKWLALTFGLGVGIS